MINLLPPEIKQGYRFGRTNRHLVHWITACALGIIGAGLITSFGYLYLNQSAKTYSKQIASTNQQLAAQNLSKVQKDVKDISNNLNLVVDVLSKQVLFSELLDQLTRLLPADTNLTGLSISQAQGGIDISAAAKNYAAASQIQVNLTDPNNQVFSKADIVSINCSGASEYPCAVVLRTLFSPNNPFMFTNNTKSGS
ncbi:MAG: PilN domain-containing protein [Candidatus Saccharimonadales bacterium]